MSNMGNINDVEKTADPDAQRLVDRFGREVTYLRLSVTDRCDFRCIYCMAEEMTFLPRSEILTLEELALVGRAFVELGVQKIRMTGGEPLVRKGVLGLVETLAEMQGLKSLVMTTNGSHLKSQAVALRKAGIKRLNISLDSLKPERFKHLTRVGDLETVLEGIDAALNAGFEGIKLNVVALRNRNHDEVLDLVRFALAREIDISFIEEMPLGQVDGRLRGEEFYPSSLIRADIAQAFELLPSSLDTGGPSRYWRIEGYGTRIGFISPHSENFCASCNRVRVTAEGKLLLCLGNEHSMDLRPIVRAHPEQTGPLKEAIREAMALKPERHHFDLGEKPVILRHMSRTGG